MGCPSSLRPCSRGRQDVGLGTGKCSWHFSLWSLEGHKEELPVILDFCMLLPWSLDGVQGLWVGQEIGGLEFCVVEDNLTTFCCRSLICIKMFGYILYVTCLFEMGTFSL